MKNKKKDMLKEKNGSRSAHNKFVWFQYDNIDAQRRILFDTQILTNF